MFYQCPECKKRWQYPILKCPDCFSELERMPVRGKIKVIGISKVTIPTLLHPKVPYFVLVLEDEQGNKWVQKSIKEYQLGEEFEIKKNENKTAVAVWRVKYDVSWAIEKVIDLIGGLKINQDSKILILPTLITPKHPYFAVNTNPKILEGLVKYLIKIGGEAKNIKVAAQSFDGTPIEASAQKARLLAVCLENKIEPLDLVKTKFVKKQKNDLTFELSEEVFKSDLIINLPILKLDSKLGVKGALENVFRFLKKESYLALKYLHSEEELMLKLDEVLPDRLTIAEAISIQKTTGFTGYLALVLASFNPLNLDRVFAEITMTKKLPEYLKKVEIEQVPIAGREIEEVQLDLEAIDI